MQAFAQLATDKPAVALQYVMHFPKGERYVSIVKDAAEPEAQAALLAERARLRKLIKHQMAETAMIADADEGLGQNADEVSYDVCSPAASNQLACIGCAISMCSHRLYLTPCEMPTHDTVTYCC